MAFDISKLNKDKLRLHIMELLKKDIASRDGLKWSELRKYDEYAYEHNRDKNNDPWTNSAHFSAGLTRALVDTAHANVIDGIFADDSKVVDVIGVGDEDIKNARSLSSILNWQVLSDIEDAYQVIDTTVLVSIKNANACIKVIPGYQGNEKNRVKWIHCPVERLFFSPDIKSAQPQHCDHIFELITFTEIEKEQRRYLKNNQGQLVYEGIENLKKGFKVQMDTSFESLMITKDKFSGIDLSTRYSQDLYFSLECYLTWWDEEQKETCELIVRVAPHGGFIMGVELNTDVDESTGLAVRPYSLRWIPFPRPDRIYGDSLPYIVKSDQEELDHSINQNINAADELIKPMKFYDPAGGFDPYQAEQVPGGWYPMPDPTRNIYIPTMNFNPIFERSFERYWEYAQRKTGLTELFQGRQQDSSRTLGEAQLRTNKTEIRFKAIYKRFEMAFNELMQLTYFYDKKYMPDTVKVKVLGTSETAPVKNLFPSGIQGRYNFKFSSRPSNEKEEKRRNVQDFVDRMMPMAIVTESLENQYKIGELYAECKDIRNYQNVIRKPKGVMAIPPEEAIQKIVGGDLQLMPDPEIDAEEYITRFSIYMRSESFQYLEPEVQQAIVQFSQRVEQIRAGQIQGILDAQELLGSVLAPQQGKMPPQGAAAPATGGENV